MRGSIRWLAGFSGNGQTFILDTDASDEDIGGVLSQEGPDDRVNVIAYASDIANQDVTPQSPANRDLFAINSFVRHFRHYQRQGPDLASADEKRRSRGRMLVRGTSTMPFRS